MNRINSAVEKIRSRGCLSRSLAMLCALLLTACASQTPYAPANGSSYGYTEQELTSDRYRVTFTGNTSTSADRVQDYALLRAAELTVQKGNDWFEVVARDQESEARSSGPGTRVTRTTVPTTQTSCGLLGCTTRHSSAYTGMSMETPVRERQRYVSRLEIVMGQGEPQDPNRVYNARELIESIRARL